MAYYNLNRIHVSIVPNTFRNESRESRVRPLSPSHPTQSNSGGTGLVGHRQYGNRANRGQLLTWMPYEDL
jgi:hypothetical protein